VECGDANAHHRSSLVLRDTVTSLRTLHTEGDAAVLLDAFNDALAALNDLPAVIAGLADVTLTDFNDVEPERQVIGTAARVKNNCGTTGLLTQRDAGRRRWVRDMCRQV